MSNFLFTESYCIFWLFGIVNQIHSDPAMSGQGSKYCDGSLCERKSFPADYAAACHLDPGPRWPISNSQGYFQLIIHLCHLDTYHRDSQFFDLHDDYRAKKIQKGDLFTTLSTQKVISKFRPCRPTFAHRYSQQMAPSSAPRRLNHNSTCV